MPDLIPRNSISTHVFMLLQPQGKHMTDCNTAAIIFLAEQLDKTLNMVLGLDGPSGASIGEEIIRRHAEIIEPEDQPEHSDDIKPGKTYVAPSSAVREESTDGEDIDI